MIGRLADGLRRHVLPDRARQAGDRAIAVGLLEREAQGAEAAHRQAGDRAAAALAAHRQRLFDARGSSSSSAVSKSPGPPTAAELTYQLLPASGMTTSIGRMRRAPINGRAWSGRRRASASRGSRR